jgi:hypothetical protein
MIVFGIEKLRLRFEHLSGSDCGAPRAGIVNRIMQIAARIEALTMPWIAIVFLDDAQDFLMPISFCIVDLKRLKSHHSMAKADTPLGAVIEKGS